MGGLEARHCGCEDAGGEPLGDAQPHMARDPALAGAGGEGGRRGFNRFRMGEQFAPLFGQPAFVAR